MKKSQIIGWVINALLATGLVITALVVPSLATFMAIAPALTFTGILQSFFTIIIPAEKQKIKLEEEQKILAKAHLTDNGIKAEKVFEYLRTKTNSLPLRYNERYSNDIEKSKTKTEHIDNNENTIER